MRLGIDIGGTKIDAVVLGDDGSVVQRVRVATGQGAQAVLDSATDAATQVSALVGLAPVEFTSIGVGIPGVVENGRVKHAVNLDVDDLDLGSALELRLGAPVRVENDVKAASLGVYHLLGLAGSMAYLNLGTGLAAGFVFDGALWRGAHGTAGEIGHIPVDPDGDECPCGQRGCLETVASGSGVARRFATAHPLPVLDLFDRADEGEADAVRVRDSLIEGVAAAVRLLVLTTDVHVVVIGGGISNLGDRLLTRVRTVLDEWAASSSFLASLELASRVRLAPQDRAVAAVGAALVGVPVSLVE